jgi:pyruvate/2-oxoglutarate dehydrogenase complex dihydrolipoamide dehydrogenase (E3) component
MEAEKFKVNVNLCESQSDVKPGINIANYDVKAGVVPRRGRPARLDIPGGELAISSDDLFSLPHAPGRTLVVGASYVALECAGFLRGLGYDVSVMVRSILLRGFDTDCAEMIGKHMEGAGVRFLRPATPQSIEKQADGKLKVSWVNAETGAATSELFDSVFTATGRAPDTAKLGVAAAGVAVDSEGKVPVVGEQTNVPHVYAIGDVVSGGLELTPVAIMAGRLLARLAPRALAPGPRGLPADHLCRAPAAAVPGPRGHVAGDGDLRAGADAGLQVRLHDDLRGAAGLGQEHAGQAAGHRLVC